MQYFVEAMKDLEFKRRAFAGFYAQLETDPPAGRTPCWDESFLSEDDTGKKFVTLLDYQGRLVCVYRIGNQMQLRRLIRTPKFIKQHISTPL